MYARKMGARGLFDPKSVVFGLKRSKKLQRTVAGLQKAFSNPLNSQSLPQILAQAQFILGQLMAHVTQEITCSGG